MDKLTDVINYFKTIDLKQIIDILIAIAVIIFFIYLVQVCRIF